MTRLRDLIPARTEPRAFDSAMARPAALGRHRVDRSAAGAAPALRQRRGLCGRDVTACPTSCITSLYDLYGLLPLNAYNFDADRRRAGAAALHGSVRISSRSAYLVLISIGQIYVILMLGILSDLHIFFMLVGAMLFFFGIQNWKLFLGLLPPTRRRCCCSRSTLRRSMATCCRTTAACATCLEPHLMSVVIDQCGADLLCAQCWCTAPRSTCAATRAFRGADRDRDAGCRSRRG